MTTTSASAATILTELHALALAAGEANATRKVVDALLDWHRLYPTDDVWTSEHIVDVLTK